MDREFTMKGALERGDLRWNALSAVKALPDETGLPLTQAVLTIRCPNRPMCPGCLKLKCVVTSYAAAALGFQRPRVVIIPTILHQASTTPYKLKYQLSRYGVTFSI